MNIAIPVFGNRVSPRFDRAAAFLLVRVSDGIIRQRTERPMLGAVGLRLTELLTDDNVDVLLCGGIRRCDYFSIAETGIEVYPGLMGETNDILHAFLRGEMSRDSSWGTSFPAMTKKRGRGHGGNRRTPVRRRSRGSSMPGLNRSKGTARSD